MYDTNSVHDTSPTTSWCRVNQFIHSTSGVPSGKLLTILHLGTWISHLGVTNSLSEPLGYHWSKQQFLWDTCWTFTAGPPPVPPTGGSNVNWVIRRCWVKTSLVQGLHMSWGTLGGLRVLCVFEKRSISELKNTVSMWWPSACEDSSRPTSWPAITGCHSVYDSRGLVWNERIRECFLFYPHYLTNNLPPGTSTYLLKITAQTLWWRASCYCRVHLSPFSWENVPNFWRGWRLRSWWKHEKWRAFFFPTRGVSPAWRSHLKFGDKAAFPFWANVLVYICE